MGKGKIPFEKTFFLKHAELIISVRETILDNFQQKIQIKFKHLKQLLNQYLIHLNKQKNKLRNPHLNCIQIFAIKLQMMKKKHK